MDDDADAKPEPKPATSPDASVPPAESEPPAEAAPPAAADLIPTSPDPEHVSPSGWVYPVTLGDRVAALTSATLRLGLALFGAFSLALFLLWAIPSARVATSASYAAARERALRDGLLLAELGGGLKCEDVPSRYRLGEEGGDLFEFAVQGSSGRAQVRAQIHDGRVVSFQVVKLEPGVWR